MSVQNLMKSPTDIQKVPWTKRKSGQPVNWHFHPLERKLGFLFIPTNTSLAVKALKARSYPGPRRCELFHVFLSPLLRKFHISQRPQLYLITLPMPPTLRCAGKPSQWAFIHINRSATCEFSSAIMIIKPVAFLSLGVWVIYMSGEVCYERLSEGFHWTVTSCQE